MRLVSFLLSFSLHCALGLAILFWPSSSAIEINENPVLISLVDGAQGGNRMPSPVLGPQGEVGTTIAPAAPSKPNPTPTPTPIAESERTPIMTPQEERQKVEEPPKLRAEPQPVPKPEPKPEPQPKPKPESKPEPKPVSEPKPEPKPKPKPEPKPEPKPTPKPEPKPKPKPTPPKKVDPVQAALQKAREEAARKPSPVEQALAEARRDAGGHGGGGGGEGSGVGGGGLSEVYLGQVMMAVRPHWGYASGSRATLVCHVFVKLDGNGTVLRADLARSSGNAQYDASAVNAVVRTGAARQFPAPPSPEYYELILVFNSSEMMGR